MFVEILSGKALCDFLNADANLSSYVMKVLKVCKASTDCPKNFFRVTIQTQSSDICEVEIAPYDFRFDCSFARISEEKWLLFMAKQFGGKYVEAYALNSNKNLEMNLGIALKNYFAALKTRQNYIRMMADVASKNI